MRKLHTSLFGKAVYFFPYLVPQGSSYVAPENTY